MPLLDQELRGLLHRGRGTGSRRCRRRRRARCAAGRAAACCGSSLGTMRYWMLGRSKLATKCRASRQVRAGWRSRAWVASVAVAVSAMRGTSGQRSCSIGQRQVVGPEVVAPLRHAVRLVDREQRDLAPVEQPQRSTRPAAARGRGRAGRARRRGTPPRPARRSSRSWVELRNPARTPSARSASTWSCISAISGEITTPTPRGPAPGSGSTATCRRRSASARARRRRRRRAR